MAQQAMTFLQGLDEAQRAEGLRENSVLTRSSLNALEIAKSAPISQVRAFVESEGDRFRQQGLDTRNTDFALQQDDEGLMRLLTLQAREGLSIEQLAEQQLIDPTTFGLRTQLQEKGF